MSDRNHELKATLATLASSHAHIAEAHRSARCLHVKSNGVRCGSPAMRRNAFCFFHDRYYNASTEDTFPPLEDANAVQVALMQVLARLRREALRPGPLDLRAVNSLLYGLQTAAFNSKRTHFDPPGFRSEMVTDDPLVGDRPDSAELADDDEPEPAAARKPPGVEAPDFSRGSTELHPVRKSIAKKSQPLQGRQNVL